ncbi:GumC family protein [Brumimicrobium mesophilum]|uniref:GumC family protein n=1 Tax=Brumimicrobium mesophilum TaxID=392717 RepID=UPI000D1413B3|nr:GNVR domain-containing protein [Brumimicrobium mesophilum]
MSDTLNFLRPYLRGWPIIIGAMIIAYLIANKYLNYVTPMYESTAKLRLADMNEGVPNSNLFSDLDVFATTQKINAEIELLKSHTLISKALEKVPFDVQMFREGSLRKTELFDDKPVLISPINWPEKLKDKTFSLQVFEDKTFTVKSQDGKIFKGSLGDTILIENALTLFELNEAFIATKKELKITDNYLFSVLSKAKQISLINSQIDIIAVDKDVPVIRISYKSSHPGKAALFPNALAEAYIDDYIENKYGAANITVDFLNERIAEISKKLNKSEQMILKYRDQKNITNIRQETETELRKISQLKIQLTNLEMSLEAIRNLENYVQSGKDNFLDLAPNFEAFTDLLSTEIIKNIKQLQAERKDLLLEYTENDEKVKVIDAKLNDLTSYLIESISNTRKNLQTKYEKLQADIEKAEKVFIDVPEKERMMTILNREFEIFQQSYNFLNQKKIEAEIAKAAKIAFHRIITPASISKEPVSPNRIIIKVVSAILGMMGAIVLIFIVHTIKGRVNNVSTIESQSMIPILTTIPKLKSLSEKENFFIKTLSEWEVKGLIKENKLLCLTGFNHHHGTGFIANQINNIMSIQNRKTLIIEFENKSSIGNNGELSVQSFNDSTDILKVSNHQIKTLTTKKWQEILKEKAQQYDFTFLINSVFGESHTLAGMATSDLNIICLDTRLTPAKHISKVDILQQEYQLPNMYYALNRVGYNPSFIRESVKWIKRKIKQFKLKK